MEALRNLKYIKDNRATYADWKNQQNIQEARVAVLRKKGKFTQEELDKASSYGSTLISSINVMDQLSINRSENALVSINTAFSAATNIFSAIGAGVGYAISKFSNNPNKTPKIAAYVGYIVASLIGVVAGEFLGAHFEKMATRIARYQTREKDLRDIRNFVVYNKNQVAEAEKIAKELPEVKDITEDLSFKETMNPIKVFKNSIKTIKELKNDYSSYTDWRRKYKEAEKNKLEKFAQMEISSAEKNNAEKERDNLLNVVKKLETASNNYEINAELGVRTAAALASFISVSGGFLLSWVLSRVSGRMANSPKTSAAIDVMSKLSIPAGFVGMMFLAGPLVKIVKESARLGRHKEKEEFLKNPTNFISFSDEEKASIQDVGPINDSEKVGMKKVLQNFNDIWKMKDEIREYTKHKKEYSQKELKLREALRQIPITQAQEEEAKKLQAQTFAVFEKIDDKSESFVDDTNAAFNSVSTLINGTACTVANLLTLKLFGNKISKLTKDKKMPGFWEGIKLTKHLKLKDLTLIFIAPFLATRLIILAVSSIGAEVKKYACQIGIMSAMKDLEDPKNFII